MLVTYKDQATGGNEPEEDKENGYQQNIAEDATCNLGVADWHGREQIRQNLRAFIDTGFTALHDVVEYWDGGSLKVFWGTVTMTPDDKSKPVVRPVMTHFFYMDEQGPSKCADGSVLSDRSSSDGTEVQEAMQTSQRT